MRIFLFVPQLRTGGAQQVAILLSSGLASLNHDVYIVTAKLEGELIQRVNSRCKLVDLKAGKPIRACRGLAKLVNEMKPDAVICFGIYTGIAAALSKLSWELSPAFIIRNENNLHVDWEQATALNRLIGPLLSRWAARQAHIVAVSRALAPATSSYLGIPPTEVTVIPNPVIDDTSNPAPMPDANLHYSLRERTLPTFIAMGRLEHQKGFDVLIDAFALVKQRTQARLVIFGQGSLREKLQAQIDRLGLKEDIALAGHTDHPMTQMGAAHAFVLSSRFEGFGLVLVEALAAGTRVIATDCDYGPSEILENGRFGSLVPVENAEALADAMLDSLRNPDSSTRPGNEWFEQFTATEAARQHVALIQSLL
ncbi:MAG: glycosyltransferase [Thermomonas sp.]|uniref:glycosyltransferase n=1 Tax=Thermomonas sp. TaxID=1971895 RepID=UPI0039E429B2